MATNNSAGIQTPNDIVYKDVTQTLTNKRNVPRVTTVASDAAPTPNIDTTDCYHITALAVGATFGAPTGTPYDGQPLVIRIKDDGTAHSLGFNAAYRFSTDLAAPTTTIPGMTLYIGLKYNSADLTWDCLATLNNL